MTNVHATTSSAPLIVYIDIKSPYAFVAIEPTLALQESLGITFDWRPLTLDIPSFLGSAKKKKGKVVASTRSPAQWIGVKYAYADARRYAERQGHILKGTEKIWDSSIANMGITFVMQQDPQRLRAYFNEVYPPFWRRELDIEDVSIVAGALQRAGLDTDSFEAYVNGSGREAHDHLQAQLHPAGIYGVPTYVFDEHILFGREHLPLVRWHLEGKVGTPPDIAYTI